MSRSYSWELWRCRMLFLVTVRRNLWNIVRKRKENLNVAGVEPAPLKMLEKYSLFVLIMSMFYSSFFYVNFSFFLCYLGIMITWYLYQKSLFKYNLLLLSFLLQIMISIKFEILHKNKGILIDNNRNRNRKNFNR